MQQFENYVGRHGEATMQAIIEQIEKTQGIRHSHPQPLETRWMIAMGYNETLAA